MRTVLFSWKNRSEHDELVIKIVDVLLRQKLQETISFMRSEEYSDETEFELFCSVDRDISAVIELLDIDMEWLLGFLCNQRNDAPLLSSHFIDMLPKGYAFTMRRETICDETTDTYECPTCHPVPFIYIVKET